MLFAPTFLEIQLCPHVFGRFSFKEKKNISVLMQFGRKEILKSQEPKLMENFFRSDHYKNICLFIRAGNWEFYELSLFI